MTHDPLKLEYQLCFPLYAASKEMVRRYQPLLRPLGLTYTQYITMLVLWEQESISVKSLGDRLYLDSGTLSPLLKRLEARGLVQKERSGADERQVFVSITQKGRALRAKALSVPQEMQRRLSFSSGDAQSLALLLQKLLFSLSKP